jgi:uncharacterized protein
VIARAFALAVLLAGAALAEVPVPKLSARVTDLTGTLTASERSTLEEKLAAFERAKGSQVAVLLVPTTQPETIEQYGIRVAEAWKIGRERVDDGVILIVAKNDRELRIEVGYGLEGAVPDAIANRIIDEIIVPRFRADDFAGGIASGVDQLIRVIEGEPLPPPPQRPRGLTGPSVEHIWMILFVPLAIGMLIRRMLNRVSGGIAAAGVAGAIGWWWTGQLVIGAVFALICGILILAAGHGGHGRWSSRGGSWAGGGGFGGGGGWSGGGGGFGGGGASGRW